MDPINLISFFCFSGPSIIWEELNIHNFLFHWTYLYPFYRHPRVVTADMKVILGSYSQSSERFSDISRGRQCVPCCLIVLICLSNSSHTDWDWAELNNIIDNGDNLYILVNSLVKRTNDFLMPIELPSTFCLHDQFCCIKFLNNTFGKIGSTECDNIGSPLNIALAAAFAHSDECILILNEYAIAVAKVAGSKFILFDCHSRDKHGLPDSEGTSILIEFNSLDSLHEHLMRLSGSLNVLGQQYEAIPIKLRVLNKVTALKVKSPVAFIDSPEMSRVPILQADYQDVNCSLSVINLDCHCLTLVRLLSLPKTLFVNWCGSTKIFWSHLKMCASSKDSLSILTKSCVR